MDQRLALSTAYFTTAGSVPQIVILSEYITVFPGELQRWSRVRTRKRRERWSLRHSAQGRRSESEETARRVEERQAWKLRIWVNNWPADCSSYSKWVRWTRSEAFAKSLKMACGTIRPSKTCMTLLIRHNTFYFRTCQARSLVGGPRDFSAADLTIW